MKKFGFLAAAALAVATVSPALAQGTAPAVGATVDGPDGQPVGTVDQINGDVVVLNTGTMVASLPVAAFGTSEAGPTVSINKTDLEAAITAQAQQLAAALDAALIEGAELHSADGVVVGKVKSVNADGLVVVDHTAGPISLPKAQMALTNGKLTFLANAADLEAAVKAQAGS